MLLLYCVSEVKDPDKSNGASLRCSIANKNISQAYGNTGTEVGTIQNPTQSSNPPNPGKHKKSWEFQHKGQRQTDTETEKHKD